MNQPAKQQAEDGLPSLRPVVVREIGGKQLDRVLPDQRFQRDRRPRPSPDLIGPFRECAQEGLQFVASKRPHVAVQRDPHGIGLDKGESRGSVEGRQPSGQSAQFRDDNAVFSSHEGEHAARRDSGVDAGVEEARAEELGQLSVRDNETAVRASAKQVGLQSPLQCRLVAVGDILQTEDVGIFGWIDGDLLLVGQQEERRKVSGRGYDPVERDERCEALGGTVLWIGLASQGATRILERGAAVAGPLVGSHGLDQQPERVRVAEQPLQTAVTRFVQKTVRVRHPEVGEDAQNVPVPERFEVEDTDIAVARGRDDFLQVVSPQPVRRPTGESEVGASKVFESLEDQVHGPASVRAARAHFVQSVNEQRLRPPLGMPVEPSGDEAACGDGFTARIGVALLLERFRLPRTRVPQQHVGAFGPEFGERSGATVFPIDHGHGSRDDRAHQSPPANRMRVRQGTRSAELLLVRRPAASALSETSSGKPEAPAGPGPTCRS